jgi:flagellar assembly protein FliH
MSKLVFKSAEVQTLGKSVKLDRPETMVVSRIDDEALRLKRLQEEQNSIREDNKSYIKKTQDEADDILRIAREQAAQIIHEAEEEAFKHIQIAVDKANLKEAEIFASREKEIRQHEEEARLLMERTERQIEDIKAQAKREGVETGYQDGYQNGKAEANRLIDRLKVMIETAIDKREEIISSAEEQIVRIILLMARKVVKHITEKDENVVVENIKAALARIQGKEQVIIKINSKDLEMSTEHKEEFIGMIEELKNVKILEDSRVDRGGCIIETDYGSIDARIATQLEELEDKIREMAHMTMFDSVIKNNEQPVQPTEG